MKTSIRLSTIILLGMLLFAACAPVTPLPSQPSLDGSAWILNQLNGQPLLSDTQITLQFSEGKLYGSDGCNRYNGNYQQDCSKCTVGEGLISTMMACPEDIMTQADAYREALHNSASAQISENSLSLLDANGKTLAVFNKQDTSLSDTSWKVIAYNNGKEAVVSLLADTELSLTFGADGQLGGSAGCNNYSASYTVSDDQLTVGPAAATLMACPEEDLMEQESLYLAALAQATTWHMEGDGLRLLNADGATLVQLTRNK